MLFDGAIVPAGAIAVSCFLCFFLWVPAIMPPPAGAIVWDGAIAFEGTMALWDAMLSASAGAASSAVPSANAAPINAVFVTIFSGEGCACQYGRRGAAVTRGERNFACRLSAM
jgi:hypothetical protein